MDVEKPVGAALSRDISRGEVVDADLDRLVERRHEKRILEEGERAEEEAWKESTRVFNEKRRQEARVAWGLHHRDQASRLRTTLQELIAHHEEKAQELIGGPDAA